CSRPIGQQTSPPQISGFGEKEWLACVDPIVLGWWIQGFRSQRKQRFFTCACGRLVWDRLPETGRQAIEVAERYADGHATDPELAQAHTAACESRLTGEVGWLASSATGPIVYPIHAIQILRPRHSVSFPSRVRAFVTALFGKQLADLNSSLVFLLHDITGNPF